MINVQYISLQKITLFPTRPLLNVPYHVENYIILMEYKLGCSFLYTKQWNSLKLVVL